MKRLVYVLAIALVIFMLVACDDSTSSQTTTFVSDSTSGSSRPNENTTTTTHTHSGNTTTHIIDGDSHEHSTTQNPNGNEGEVTQGDSDSITTTSNDHATTGPSIIVTTTRKNESTSSGKGTTTTTTKPTTTTTTKKTTTTTTKKTTTTTKSHSYSKVSYTRVDINSHKVTSKCTVCGTTTTQTEWHTWGAWKYDSYPTSTTDGVKYRICTGCGEEQVTVAPATSLNTKNFEEEVFELVNKERAKNGLAPLTYYTAGQSGANTRAKELMTYFSHTRPDGTKWWTVSSFDRSVCQAGAENIARGYGGPEDVVAAFMASADHRKNILSTTYTHIVLGY